MKGPMFLSVAAAALLVGDVHAFPGRLAEMANHFSPVEGRTPDPAAKEAMKASLLKSASLGKRAFDPESQLVSTTGQHAFKAPSGSDQRGPCPGLNALANHGYLPHNGIATIPEFITATGDGFNMAVDLATFLAVYGAVFDGDLTSWSIGGPASSLLGLGGLLGEPQGISGSHNKYEGDVSPTRGDLYQYGNGYEVQLSQFQALFDLGKAKDSYDLDILTNYRTTRFQESIDNNPYFFNAPFSGVVASPAAWAFIFRFMGNNSAEYPDGYLNGDVLKSFYAITGDDGNFQYTPGHERFPDNWYKRSVPYSIPLLAVDSNVMLLEHPEFGSVGGNTGTTNSFTGIDPSDLTGGVFDASTLADNNNLLCYGLRVGVQEAPDLLSGLFTDINPALDKLGSAINTATNSLGCPQLNSIDKNQFNKYPGYSKLQKDGSY